MFRDLLMGKLQNKCKSDVQIAPFLQFTCCAIFEVYRRFYECPFFATYTFDLRPSCTFPNLYFTSCNCSSSRDSISYYLRASNGMHLTGAATGKAPLAAWKAHLTDVTALHRSAYTRALYTGAADGTMCLYVLLCIETWGCLSLMFAGKEIVEGW